MHYGKISGFSDEITEITKEQFEALNKFGISYFEPRGIDGKNVSTLTEEEMYWLKELMDEYGIKEMVRTGVAALERGEKLLVDYDDYIEEI